MSDSEFSCLHSSRVRVDCRAVETAVIFVQCQRSASALISAARRMNVRPSVNFPKGYA